MNEKGMECLTNMKKEINENWFTFQMKTMEISISVKRFTFLRIKFTNYKNV